VLGFAQHRGRAGDGRLGILQLGGRIGGAALLAVVAVLVGAAALGTGALDEAVGQEHLLVRVEILGDRTGGDVAVFAQLQVDGARQLAILFRMGGMEVVEGHAEVGEIGAVLALDVVDQLFGRDALAFGAQHDGGAMGIIGTDIDALIAAQFLIAHPDVSLDVLQHMGPCGRGGWSRWHRAGRW